MRYYEKEFPEVDQLVMVQVKQIAEMGAYVSLLEYDNIEGMILLSELSRRRIRSVQKLIRVGRNEVVVVMRVDPEKGYIDLSKRRVSAEEVIKCEEQYEKSKAVDSIIIQVAKKHNLDPEVLYRSVVWPLGKKYGHAHDAFKIAVADADTVLEGLTIDPSVRSDLLSTIARRLTPKPVKVRSDLEVTCYSYEGINGIKSALRAGEELSTEQVPIKIRLVAPPLYVMSTTSTDKNAAIELMEKAIVRIGEEIEKYDGQMNVAMRPKAVSAVEDDALARLMEQAERENAQVSGDEDSEGEEEE